MKVHWTVIGHFSCPYTTLASKIAVTEQSTELNQQSKGKLLAACDHVPFHRLVTVDSESFDEERLASGHVYFINTQLLGKDKLLTKGCDKKTFTFWQTVANTIAAGPEDFVLIIDEAHRGADVSEKARKPEIKSNVGYAAFWK